MEDESWNTNMGCLADSVTLQQTSQGKWYVLIAVEANTGWLETYPIPCATAWNATLGLEKQSPLMTWHPRRNWVTRRDSFLKQLHRHQGQRAWRWVGIAHLLSSTSPWENWMVKWTVKNYLESNGWWDIQTSGYTHPWDCFYSRTWVYLVGDAEGWRVHCGPQEDLLLGVNSQLFELHDGNCYIILYVIAACFLYAVSMVLE